MIRRAKSREVLEGRVAARLDERLDGLPSDALDGGKRVEDRAPALERRTDIEDDAGAVDRGRLDTDAEALRLAAEFGELVGVVEVERHGRRQELDRVVGLQIGRLERDERVGRGVALVEAVIGELGEEVEDLVGLALVQTRAAMAPCTKRSRWASISALIFLPMARRRRSASPSE